MILLNKDKESLVPISWILHAIFRSMIGLDPLLQTQRPFISVGDLLGGVLGFEFGAMGSILSKAGGLFRKRKETSSAPIVDWDL